MSRLPLTYQRNFVAEDGSCNQDYIIKFHATHSILAVSKVENNDVNR